MLPRASVDTKPRSRRALLKHCVTTSMSTNSSAAEPYVGLSVHVWPRGIRAQHQRVTNPKFGNVLWTFCSAGSSTLNQWFWWFGSFASPHNISLRVCVFAWAGTHVCLCVGGNPTLKTQLLLSPLSPNFFSLFPHRSRLWRPPLPDSFSSLAVVESSELQVTLLRSFIAK